MQVSVTPKKGPHTLHSVKIQISPKEEMEVNSLFLITRVLRPKNMNKCTSWNIVSSREKKANIKFVMYCIKINFTLVQVYFPFTRKGKGYENEFKLQKKKYTEISATLPSPQKVSILKTMVYMVF